MMVPVSLPPTGSHKFLKRSAKWAMRFGVTRKDCLKIERVFFLIDKLVVGFNPFEKY